MYTYLTYDTEGNTKARSKLTNKKCPVIAESLKPFSFLRSTLTLGLAIWYNMSRTCIPTPTKIPYSRPQNRQRDGVARMSYEAIEPMRLLRSNSSPRTRNLKKCLKNIPTYSTWTSPLVQAAGPSVTNFTKFNIPLF